MTRSPNTGTGPSPEPVSSTSTSLLERVKAQDPKAWKRLVALYGPLVYDWCRQSGLHGEDAADIGQEVFGSVAAKVAEFRRDRPGDSFRGWLWTITRNKIRDPFRQQQGRAQAQGGTDAQQRLAQIADQPSTETFVVRELGEYQLLEKLGQGGMGAVYKARQTKLKKIVALKVLPKERMQDERAVARFEREMAAVGAVDHPNIVRAMDAREIDGTHFLVMEYVEGLDLSQLLRRQGPLPIADACELIRQAATGLQYAHEHGLVHRDIKPSNLMLTRDGTVKILDLGLALLAADDAGADMTGTGQAMGTADYMAPEQAADSHTVDIRADVYSLGCTLYKLLSGHAPFSGPQYKSNLEKMAAHLRDPVPPIREVRPDVPDDLAAVLDRMLAKAPADRFAAPGEVAAALKPLAAGADLPSLLKQAEEKVRPPGRDEKAPGSTEPYPSSALVGTESHHGSRPQPAPLAGRRRWKRWMIAAGLLPLAIALGVVIYINGTRLEVPEGSDVTVREDGIEIVTPDKPSPGTTSSKAVRQGWIPTGSLHVPREFHTATRLADGRVLVVAGRVGYTEEGKGIFTNTCELYDPATGKWRLAASLRGPPRYGHPAALLHDGRVLVAGGVSAVDAAAKSLSGSDAVEAYDPATDKWTRLASLPTPTQGNSLTVLQDGRVLAAGGVGAGNNAYLYDPVAGKWEATKGMNAPRDRHCSFLLPDGKVLVAAGRSAGTSTEIFDPATQTWTPGPPTQKKRNQRAQGATRLKDGSILLAGAYWPATETCERFIPATQQWTATDSLSEACEFPVLVTLPSGDVMRFGGQWIDRANKKAENFATTQRYDVRTGRWAMGPPMPSAVIDFTATVLDNGQVLIAGGCARHPDQARHPDKSWLYVVHPRSCYLFTPDEVQVR